MKIYQNQFFQRFAKKENLSEKSLCDAIERAHRGLVDADLGGGVLKQRIARSGEGRSGGFRSIILFRAGSLAIFVYGYAKNARENITKDELRGFRELAKEMLNYDEAQLRVSVAKNVLKEVTCNE